MLHEDERACGIVVDQEKKYDIIVNQIGIYLYM